MHWLDTLVLAVGSLAAIFYFIWHENAEERRLRGAEEHQQQQQRRAAEELQLERAREIIEQQQQRRAAQLERAREIDLFIRTRRRFNTSNPLEYACEIAVIERECHLAAREIINRFDGLLFTIANGGA